MHLAAALNRTGARPMVQCESCPDLKNLSFRLLDEHLRKDRYLMTSPFAVFRPQGAAMADGILCHLFYFIAMVSLHAYQATKARPQGRATIA
jgi:hypothetical protein